MNQPLKSVSAQILNFALDHNFTEEEIETVKLCLNDMTVLQTFQTHRQDE